MEKGSIWRDDLLGLADRLWRGEAAIEDHHPVGFQGGLAEVADGIAFLASRWRTSARSAPATGWCWSTPAATCSRRGARADARRGAPSPLHTAIYSHGHVDHVFGVRCSRRGGVGAARWWRTRTCRGASTATG